MYTASTNTSTLSGACRVLSLLNGEYPYRPYSRLQHGEVNDPWWLWVGIWIQIHQNLRYIHNTAKPEIFVCIF